MEDSSMSGEENKKEKSKGDQQDDETNSQSAKKIKLNDGSPHSTPVTAESSTADDQVDSGISIDRSEGMSSDDPSTSQGLNGPSNVVFNAGASIDGVKKILTKMGERNYRKRNNRSDSDSSGSSSSMDSDSDDGSLPRFTFGSPPGAETNSHDSTVSLPEAPQSSSDSNDASDFLNDDDDEDMDSQDGMTDSSDDIYWENHFAPRGRWMGLNISRDQIVNITPPGETPAVLQKPQPPHNWSPVKETIARELGYHSYTVGKLFESKFYGSLHAVYRMENYTKLNKHKGCVNAINFHPEGSLLVSGSDDTCIIIWDWIRSKSLLQIKTGHKSNVFQSKFLHLNSASQLNVVTCAKDGQVRLISVPSSGSPCRRKLYSHSRPAHKVHITPACPYEVISAAEDGCVIQADIRTDKHKEIIELRHKGACLPLFSVHGHPLDPTKIIISGRDKFIRAYDVRKPTAPFATYCPSLFTDVPSSKGLRVSRMYLTCAIYNHDGTEILGSYNNDDVFLFDAANDVYQSGSPKVGYSHRYTGHRNCDTFKGVSFFGPESQYVVSGSDCSYIYIWDKKTESIVQWLQADDDGVVNCVVSHPKHPILASSGLDSDVKIWFPTADSDPTFKGLASTVKINSGAQSRNPVFHFETVPGLEVDNDEEISLHINTNACSLM